MASIEGIRGAEQNVEDRFGRSLLIRVTALYLVDLDHLHLVLSLLSL